MKTISSTQNNLVKKLKLLGLKKGRERFNEFLVEGNKFALEIPASWEVTNTFLSESYYRNTTADILEKIVEPIVLSDNVFNYISDTVTPSGIISVVKMKHFCIDDLMNKSPQFIIIAAGVRDPGNLGSLIRTADASGATGVIVSPDCADIYSPKVVRSTAGSLFNLPVMSGEINDTLCTLRGKGVSILATDLKAERSLYDMQLTRPVAIVIGNESKGLDGEIIDLADMKVRLPMHGKAESLNASVAGGIIMYEVLRQRLIANNSL